MTPASDNFANLFAQLRRHRKFWSLTQDGPGRYACEVFFSDEPSMCEAMGEGQTMRDAIRDALLQLNREAANA